MQVVQKIKFKFIEGSNLVEISDINGFVKIVNVNESENLLSDFAEGKGNILKKSNVIKFPRKSSWKR